MGPTQTIGTILVELLLDDTGVDKGTKSAQRKLSGFADVLNDLAKTVDRTITRAFEAAGAAALGLAAATVGVGAGFEKEMSKVAAISGATKDELAAMTAEARRIGKDTVFSATDAAAGMEALAQAGLKPKEVITATADAMNLAGSAGINLNDATELVASTMTQFGLAAKDAGRISDVFAQANQSTLLTVQDLGVAMRYAGSTGAAFGYTLEQTTAAVAQFRNMGLVAEQAGTNFRSMMEGLSNPTKKAQNTLAALGIQLKDVDPAANSFADIMQRLADANLSVADSFAIFGTTSGANVARLAQQWDKTKTSAQGYGNVLADLNASYGTAERTFAAMADNVAGRWSELQSAVEEFLLTLYDAGKGPLARLIDGLAERVAVLTREFKTSGDDASSALDQVVDGILALTDAAIALIPRVEEIGALMVAAFVVAKGVQIAYAIVDLSSKIGVDLAGALAKAASEATLLSTAQAGIFAAGAVAGIAAQTYAIWKLYDAFTGAADAARKLAGAQQGARDFAAMSAEEQQRLADVLATTQAEIAQRAKAGDSISDMEKALLRYDAAQAATAVTTGDLIELNGRLAFTAETSTTAIDDQAQQLHENALAAKATADQLDYLVGQYSHAGLPNPSQFGSDVLEGARVASDGMTIFSGTLSKAREVTGENIDSLEQLKAAATRWRLEAERGEKQSASLDNRMGELAATTAATAKVTEETAQAKLRQAKADKAAEIAAKKAAAAQKAQDKVQQHHLGGLEETYEMVERLSREGLDPETEALIKDAQAMTHLQEAYDAFNASVQQVSDKLPEVTQAFQDEVDALVAQEEKSKFGAVFDRLVENTFPAFSDALKQASDDLMRPLSLGEKLGVVLQVGAEQAGEAWKKLGASVKAGVGALAARGGSMLGQLSGLSSVASLGGATDMAGLFGGLGAPPEGMTAETYAGSQQQQDAAKAAVTLAVQTQIQFVKGFTAALPGMLDALIAALPDLFDAIAESIPKIVETVASHLPDLIQAFVDGLVEILAHTGEIVDAILVHLPDIIAAIIANLPAIAGALIKALWDGIKRIGEFLGDVIIEALTLGFAKTSLDNKDKKGLGAGIKELLTFGLANTGFDKKPPRSRSQSGISYVPSTMSTVLEPGEAVLDAATNAARIRYQVAAPAPQAPTGAVGGPGGPLEVLVSLNDRVVDAVQYDGLRHGRMPRLRRTLRSLTGARVGFSRGRLAVWSR